MLQLAENKRAHHTQIAKKSKNGLALFRPSSAPPAVARMAVANTSTAAKLGVLPASMLPCCQRYHSAVSDGSCRARMERGE
jgi:hypothetical protein